MPPLRARLLGAVLAAAAVPVVLAGCTARAQNSCNCCCSPIVDPTGGAVWVAQGTRLLKLDPATGAIEWTRQVTSRNGHGSQEIGAVSAAPQGVWVAWNSGAALIPGRTGRATRVRIAPRASSLTLATADGRTWLGAGRRVIALHPDGSMGPTIRFPHGVRISGAPGVVVVETTPRRVLLDPRTGERLLGSVVGTNDGWRADAGADEVTLTDPATGDPVGDPLHIEQLGGIVVAPAGSAYATALNHELAVMRLDENGPRIAWRTPIEPD